MQTSQSRPFALENESMKSKTEFLPNGSDFLEFESNFLN